MTQNISSPTPLRRFASEYNTSSKSMQFKWLLQLRKLYLLVALDWDSASGEHERLHKTE